ncbi:zinc ribbon domain-containing protein [Salicibibacter cibarius]
MVKNHRLAKSITDAAWRQLIKFTTYKAENVGSEVRLINPYNTSQMCSGCGAFVKKSLSERTHRCSCGYEEHRDILQKTYYTLA